MYQLPSEVLTETFRLLDQNDKVECMTVCQHWKKVIEKNILYHTIYIFSATSLDNVSNMIQSLNNGNKVEQLVLSFYNEEEDINLGPLLLLLPNLKRFFCTGPRDRPLTKDKAIYPWQKSIEYIHEFSSGSVTNELLQQGICPSLTRLIITDYNNSIVPLLKNAPELKSLTLGSGKLCFMDLETIHEYAPYLESITLRNITWDDDTEVESMTITPSVLVTECIFKDLESIQYYFRKEVSIYIAKKYPNVTKVIYTHFPHFKHGRHGYPEELLRNLPQSSVSQLKHLCMHGFVSYDEDPFTILDRYGCQIKTLKLECISYDNFEEYMAGSQQFLHIENLCLEGAELVDRFNNMKEFKVLGKLKIVDYDHEHGKWQMGLGRLLDQTPPALKSLSLRRIYYSLEENNGVYPSVERLSFTVSSIMSGSVISRCFPNLTRLKIKNCEIPDGTLDLSTMDLFSFRFIWTHDNDRDGYNVENLDYEDNREYLDDFYDNGDDNNNDGIKNSILVITKNERRRYAKRYMINAWEMRFFRLYKMFDSQVISWPECESDPEPRYIFRFNSLKNMILE